MIRFAVAYLAALVSFLVIDFAWLSVMGPRFFRPALGGMAADSVRFAPAMVFYLLYPVGMVVFAVIPALRATTLTAAACGALLGLTAYGAYDLTNYATLKLWSLRFTIVDMAWGTALSALCAVIATWAARRFES
jgi:uncharacterized membrane protein